MHFGAPKRYHFGDLEKCLASPRFTVGSQPPVSAGHEARRGAPLSLTAPIVWPPEPHLGHTESHPIHAPQPAERSPCPTAETVVGSVKASRAYVDAYKPIRPRT